ncbi:MAG: large conductance mechanosensitive channel protein MscL [Actinocrinis sp.]
MRGNVVELAVAVVMGTAFGAIVNALVSDIVMPLIAAIFGKPDYSKLVFTVHNSKILYGSFITAIIQFLLIAFGVYFFIVMPLNHLDKLRKRRQGVPDLPPPAETELELLVQIRDALRAGAANSGPADGQ